MQFVWGRRGYKAVKWPRLRPPQVRKQRSDWKYSQAMEPRDLPLVSCFSCRAPLSRVSRGQTYWARGQTWAEPPNTTGGRLESRSGGWQKGGFSQHRWGKETESLNRVTQRKINFKVTGVAEWTKVCGLFKEKCLNGMSDREVTEEAWRTVSEGQQRSGNCNTDVEINYVNFYKKPKCFLRNW